MDVAVAVILLLFASFVALGVVAAVKTARAVKRGVERTSIEARRVVEDTGLKARRYSRPGPAGKLAELRLALRTSVTSTGEALEGQAAVDPSLSEAVALLSRLRSHARELDAELRLLEREPDRARIAARIGELEERTRRITHSADSLRWAAQDRARRFADDDLAALGRDIDLEAGALRHWAPAALPEPGPGPAPEPRIQPGARRERTSEPGAGQPPKAL
ncbi:hypothetical protein [Actinacidiphila glaucinigra]|uniref:Secreted protein n=1 Tax=Actinacidiphila glaucinigra TaxID=235986 RepID=A0A239LCI4_9ACTN|nr:hypothetical protein [Actinacidiphila glaucinigra]SNT27672.1 hypothetical protein SAMN05216252_11923 [Actinacidiphila glaucinigra]